MFCENPLNQITGMDDSIAPVWVTPSYDRSGNMTTMPQPFTPTAGYTATYDAWNRLVNLKAGSTDVAQYQYDGLNRQTIKVTYTSGSPSEPRHFYYNDNWQVVEERVGASTSPNRIYIWGSRYVDDLVIRERDTNGDGTLDERLYALQDANWNVVALCDTSGAVQERYDYTPYGVSSVLTPAYGNRPVTFFDWTYRFTGRPLDLQIGLQNNRNRYLHPPLGCWITQDPIGFEAGSMNLYRYVESNPTNDPDPSGFVAEAYPTGAEPGTFNVSLSACRGDTAQLYPGCCCTRVQVFYKPTDAEKLAYRKICLVAVVRSKHERYLCPDSDTGWHRDPPKQRQHCWSRASRAPADWDDTPGGGPRPGCSYTFPLLCRPPCAITKIVQDWEVCAVGFSGQISQTLLGCVSFGHLCNIHYGTSSLGVGILPCCCISCNTSRWGSGSDISPVRAVHL